jgi:hypothetical protein
LSQPRPRGRRAAGRRRQRRSITSTEEEKTLRSFGVSFLAGGGLMLGIGIPLWITQRSWVRGPDGSAL